MIDQAEEWLLKKYSSSKTFNKEMQDANANYDLLTQQGQYCDLSCFPENVLEKFPLKGALHADLQKNSGII